MDANEIIEQCAKLAHLLLVRDFQYPNTANVIADAIRALKTPLMTQVELIALDSALHGTGYMQAGKRIDPSDVYLRPDETVSDAMVEAAAQVIQNSSPRYGGIDVARHIARAALEAAAAKNVRG
jgi:hypothetical protein